MLISYFKYALRKLVNQRGRTLINLSGLSFSLAIVIIIFLYVSGELRVNNFHENGSRIYRMYASVEVVNMGLYKTPYQTAEMAEAIMDKVPGVEATCRLKNSREFIGPAEEKFHENVGFVDSTFFELFSYEFLAGDPVNPLGEPKSVVLTEKVARKIFRDSIGSLDQLIGQSVKFPERAPGNLYTVTAVIADPPENTSFRWEVLIPYINSGVYPRSNDFLGDSYLYVMLDENNDHAALEERSRELIEEMHGETIAQGIQMGYMKEGEHNFSYHFMPYRQLYLGSSDFRGSYETMGNRSSLYILSSIAALILLIACFNYVMISIGTAMNRLGDFGLMNVLGARRRQVLAQFVMESFLLTLSSLLLGIILAEQLLPLFNKLAGDDLSFSLYARGMNLVFLLAILLFIVISTSFYIGLYLLRKNQPMRFLRKEMLSMRRNGVARLSVVLQFFIAIALLISGGLIMKQLHYMVNRDVGFEKQNTAVVHVDFSLDKINTLKEQFLSSPYVKNVTMSDRSFNSGSSSQALKNKEGNMTSIRFIRVDTDYLKTLGLELIEGRNFMPHEADDTLAKVIVNETLVSVLDIEDPIGERVNFEMDGEEMEIIGVVRDYHFDSMHEEVEPLMLHIYAYNSIWYMFIKSEEGRMEEVLEHAEKTWNEVVPEFSWKYTFMDEILREQYQEEDRWSRVIAWAAAIAILLSCLGLMGISGILVARRYQEVGIRKANGAKVWQVIVLLNTDILKWIFLSYILACPAAWFAMRSWLQNFAHQTSLSWWIFVLAGLGALLISVLTITLQIYRVARQNPVLALRYE